MIQHIDKKRIYERMILLCWAILAFSSAVKTLGGNWFEIAVTNERFILICNYIDESVLLTAAHKYLSFIVIALLYVPTVVKNVERKQIIVMYSFFFIPKLFILGIGTVFIDIVAIILVPIYLNKGGTFNSIARYIILNCFVLFSVFIKNLKTTMYIDSAFIAAIFMIDVYFMLGLELLYFKVGGEKQWELTDLLSGLARSWQNLKRIVTQPSYRAQKWQNLTRKLQCLRTSLQGVTALKLKLFLFGLKWDIAIIATHFTFAFIVGREYEALTFLVSYLTLRYMFPKTYHHKNFYGCMYWTLVMLLTSTYVLLDISVSLISSVFVGYGVGLLLCYIQDYLDLFNKYNTDYSRFGLSKEMSDFAYDWLNVGMRDKQLLTKYELSSLSTLNSRKRRIKQAMHTK